MPRPGVAMLASTRTARMVTMPGDRRAGGEQDESRRQPGGAAELALNLQDMDDADRDEPDRG
jgi:hypothetical protein